MAPSDHFETDRYVISIRWLFIALYERSIQSWQQRRLHFCLPGKASSNLPDEAVRWQELTRQLVLSPKAAAQLLISMVVFFPHLKMAADILKICLIEWCRVKKTKGRHDKNGRCKIRTNQKFQTLMSSRRTMLERRSLSPPTTRG
jgi:hypothetical protein